MAEKITDEQVANLLAILRTDASADAKVHQINNVKSGIKQNNVPDSCVPLLFEAIRTSMTSQHAAIVNAGFSTLNHLLTRLSRQEPKHVTKEAARTLPLVVEKMGDQREKYRQLAAQCLTTFWIGAPMDVERIVKNFGLVGKNSRAKEACMNWIVLMHQEHLMPFKTFVTTLMELLEDADGMVRDTARNSVIELFQYIYKRPLSWERLIGSRNAPNTAKSDLKKQLKTFNVRPAIVSAITSQLAPSGPAEAEPEAADAAPRSHLTQSVSSASIVRPSTPVIEAKVEHVDPAYVNTQRELEDAFKEMHPYFEGKESEQNWLKREQSCTKLRKLNAGNAPSDFHDSYLAGIKSLLDGILKAVNSLRTSLSKEGCSLVQEIARTAGPGLDPMVEILLQNLIKLCGGTKKISSQQGNVTVDIIIGKVSYNVRIIQHIWAACQDKNVQPRTYATGWLKTVLKKESHHKSHVEHTGGLDLIEKCVKKGLADANPGVRESMRSAYWTFAQIWPVKAEMIMATLDTTAQRQLEMAPDNPSSPKKVDAVNVRPGLGFSKSTTGPPKPSLRETMLAQKKAAMASKSIPVRPGSAMSTFSPMRTVSNSSTSSTASTSSEAAPVRARPESTTVAHGGLSVAPMRPTKFRARPELARPATAGPYSVRRPGHAPSNSDSTSPSAIRAPNARTPSASSNSPPKRTISRPNTSHSTHTTQSTHTSPAKSTVGRVAPSARHSPVKSKAPVSTLLGSSPSKADEDLTMVLPTISGSTNKHPLNVPRTIDSSDEEEAGTSVQLLKVYEDPFSSTDAQTSTQSVLTVPVLEEVPVNEDASNLARNGSNIEDTTKAPPMSPERFKQNSRLLDSGITKIGAKSLDVHGFRKLQGMIRDNKIMWTDERFDTLLLGLFEYLEAPLASLLPEKVQDVKAQILTTIKLMYKKDHEAFGGHVHKGLESLLRTRSCYDARAHIVSGLELLADELVLLADPKETIGTVTGLLRDEKMTVEGCRMLSMGLHVLTELLDAKKEFMPTGEEVGEMCRLAARCLESSESGVRMDAVQLCVSVHARVGESRFWAKLGGVRDDPKSLITYYIVKRQREAAASG